jgi:alpha-tubulin suppressor-like RCC1 family protein
MYALRISQTLRMGFSGSFAFVAIVAALLAGSACAPDAERLRKPYVPPFETIIDSGPSGSVTSTTATFTFSCSEEPCTFTCQLDDAGWAGCTSPQEFTDLAEENHLFEVQAYDVDGNEATPADRVWTVDTTGGIATDWVELAAGGDRTCAVKTDGTLYCWGDNSYGRLGDGSYGSKLNPMQIKSDTDWLTIKLGRDHTCGLKVDGTLYCWGQNWSGQVGDGSLSDSYSPKQIGIETDWVHLVTGKQHTCGLKTNNAIYCWGEGSGGQIGSGNHEDRRVPAQVGGTTDWQNLSDGTGSGHNCAVKSNGSLFCWGVNTHGQVGIGTQSNTFTPTQVGTDVDWKSAFAGSTQSCAIKIDGTLYCWGNNFSGQLGDGSSGADAHKSRPTQIGTAVGWQGIAIGIGHTCGVDSDGALYCWGNNEYGQLGDGTIESKLTPTLVATGDDWQSVIAGDRHSCAIKSVGSIYCWGRNGSGQLGDGSQENKLVPTPVLSPVAK